MKTRLIVFAALAVSGVATTSDAATERPQPVESARAEQNPEQPPQSARKPVDPLAAEKRSDTALTSFERLDTDKDGKLSKTELGGEDGAGLEFSRIDRDGDGSISRDEWNAHWQERKDKHGGAAVPGGDSA